MTSETRAFGRSFKTRRVAMGLSQVELGRLLDWPQVKVSRTEAGARSATLEDLLSLAKALRTTVGELLESLEHPLRPARGRQTAPETSAYGAVPGLLEAELNEDAVAAQLESYGVKFLGKKRRPALFKMPLEELLVAALRFATEPRLFLALPALLVRHATTLDWTRVVSAAVMRQLQNRLGMLVSGALQLRVDARGMPREVWDTLETVHEKLEAARLDRVEYLGAEPRSAVEREHLLSRTPSWLGAWHVVGHVRTQSLVSQL